MRRNSITILVLCSSFFSLITGASILMAVETLYPTDDAYTSQEDPNGAHGLLLGLQVRNRYVSAGQNTFEMNTFVRFDLSSISPQDSVDLALLYLYYYQGTNHPESRTLTAHRVKGEWNESVITYDSEPTWVSEITDSGSVPTEQNWMMWDVTSDVRAYLHGQIDSLNGWKVMDEDSFGQDDIPKARFFSKDKGNVELSPRLDIRIIPPDVVPCGWIERCTNTMYLHWHEEYPDTTINEATRYVRDGEGAEEGIWFLTDMSWDSTFVIDGHELRKWGYYGLLVAYDTVTCDTVKTVRLPAYGNAWPAATYHGLAHNKSDTTFWYSRPIRPVAGPPLPPMTSICHIDESGNELYSVVVDSHFITGLAVDADNNHLWCIADSAPDMLLEYDVSADSLVLIQGPMPVPWDSLSDYSAAGLEYDEEYEMLIAVNRETHTLEYFIDIDPAYRGPSGPGEPGVRPALDGVCSITHTPNPWGIALYEGTRTAFVAGKTPKVAVFPLDKYKPPCVTQLFIRADANGDMYVDLSDAIYILDILNPDPDWWRRWGPSYPSCMDAVDANDDGEITEEDAAFILKFLYDREIPPPSPYPICGRDPTEDELGCNVHPCRIVARGAKTTAMKKFGGWLRFGEPQGDSHRIVVPVYLNNTVALSGFAYTIEYNPASLSVRSADNQALITESFDFFSAKPEKDKITVGNVVSLAMKKSLPPGEYHVADVVFNLTTQDLDKTELRLVDVELVDTEATALSCETVNATIDRWLHLRTPKVFALRQAFPNPFAGETSIRYQLPKDSHIELKVYNSAGQLVSTLVNEEQKPGYYRVDWNGKDAGGMKVASGVYFYRIEMSDYTATKKMILLR